MPGAVPAFLQPSINVLNLLKPQFPGDPSKALSSLGFRLFPGSLGLKRIHKGVRRLR